MRKIIAAGCLMMAMSLCVGCSSKKEGSKETTTATTEAKMKVQSKYKVPKITAAKKTDQLAEAQKGETIVTMQVKGYGEMNVPQEIRIRYQMSIGIRPGSLWRQMEIKSYMCSGG